MQARSPTSLREDSRAERFPPSGAHGSPPDPDAHRPAQQGNLSKMAKWIDLNYRRARAKDSQQLLRAIGLRIWPLSQLVHRYHRARMEPDRWAKINKTARDILEKQSWDFDDTQRRALSDLRRDGLHITHLQELLGPDANLRELIDQAHTLVNEPEMQRQIETRCSSDGAKWYVVRAFGLKKPKLPVPRVFANLALHDKILQVVNSYLGVSSRVKYLDLWYNLPATEADPPIDSERWHRDNEDTNLVKMFFYLSDVDDAAGPLHYIRGTQPGGQFGSLFPNNPPAGSYPPDGALEQQVPAEQTHRCVGSAGTLVLYDACGFHFGGRSTTKPRIILVVTYASDAAIDLRHYELKDHDQYETLSEPAKYAIRAPR